MPNWCNNELTVKGPSELLLAFDKAFKGKGAKWGPSEFEKYNKTPEQIAQLEKDYEKDYATKELVYSYDALYPIPAEVLAIGYSAPKDSRPLEQILLDLHNPDRWVDGYSWCISHWGVKWDVGYISVFGNEEGTEELEYHFESPWGPPVEWLEKVAKDWAELEFTIKFEEGGCAFAGLVTFAGGEQVEEVSIDSDGYRDFVIEHFEYDPYEGYEEEGNDEEATATLLTAMNGN